MLPWLVLRHVEHEHLGTLAAALTAANIPYRYLDVFRGAAIPGDLAGAGGLVVMGGPQGVYEADRFSFIPPELDLIGRAARAGLPVLGICLGAQMIAGALGARVYPGGRKEIGWHRLRVVAPGDPFTTALPPEFMAFHWHGDTFDLPAGATRLFESDLFLQQGFRWGRQVLALQFHFEVDRAMVAEWLNDPGCAAEVAATAGVSAAAILRDTAAHGGQLEQLSAAYFTGILSHLTADQSA